MAVEISDYYVWQVSVAKHWAFKLIVWWLVHRMRNYSRHHNSNYFNSPLYSFINVPKQLSWVLRCLWVCVFLGGTCRDNALSCTSRTSWSGGRIMA